MSPLLKRLQRMGDDELLGLSEAIDLEVDRRLELTDPVPDSARRRANSRHQCYRHSTGSPATAEFRGRAVLGGAFAGRQTLDQDCRLVRISHHTGKIDNNVFGGADILVCHICHDF